MKFAAIACLFLVVAPALSLPTLFHTSGSGSHDELHLDTPKPKKSEPNTPSDESPPYQVQHDNPPPPPPKSSEDKPTSHPEPEATTTSDTRRPFITLPFNPAVNLPFLVPTLDAPAPTSSHANSTTGATSSPTPAARRRRSALGKPSNARATPLPAIIARDGSALAGINAEEDGLTSPA